MQAEFNLEGKLSLSVDSVIFGFDDEELKILLIKRGEDPYNNMWALPGDLARLDEHLDASVARVLKELTGLSDVFMEQVKTFGDLGRHPLGRVVTVAYYSLIKISDYNLNPSSFATEARWHSVTKVSELAFDHNRILAACKERLQQSVRVRPIGFELLPRFFTLRELQSLYQAVLQQQFDTRNFRKKILSMNLLQDTGNLQSSVSHRPAKLFQFDEERYQMLKSKGLVFEL